jgi:O-succinylbenzoic acid--CoA ligase
VVVGGGALDPALYLKARQLGWPLLPSYGLTECASQVATAALVSLDRHEFPALEPLDHVAVRLRDDRLQIRTTSLCHVIATADSSGALQAFAPALESWFTTEDRALWDGQSLRPLGRATEIFKVKGELVSVAQVEESVRSVLPELSSFAVAAQSEPRDGTGWCLITDQNSLPAIDKDIQRYNEQCPPLHRLRNWVWIDAIPRSALGKTLKGELKSRLPFLK